MFYHDEENPFDVFCADQPTFILWLIYLFIRDDEWFFIADDLNDAKWHRLALFCLRLSILSRAAKDVLKTRGFDHLQ